MHYLKSERQLCRRSLYRAMTRIYEAFADVAQAADGTLVCTYRESMGHSSRPFSRIIVRRSFDRGLTWGPRQVVVERS